MLGLVICWVVIDLGADMCACTLSARFTCSTVSVFVLFYLWFCGNAVVIYVLFCNYEGGT